MKAHIKNFADKINFWNVFIGLVIGFGVGVYTLNAITPTSDQMLKLCKLDKASLQENRNANVTYTGSHNPYMMGKVTSEKQFVEEMIKHHEAAVTMAQQVLTLNPRAEIKKLANDIISAQTTEIKMMKDWLAAWR